MKKIIISIPNLRYGGTEFVLIQIINYLIKKNFKIYLHTKIVLDIQNFKNIDREKLIYLKSSNNYFARILKLSYYIKKHKIETIFALQSSIILSFLVKIILFPKLKIIGRISTIISEQIKNSNSLTKLKLIFFLFCLSKINLIIAQSENMKMDLISTFKRFSINNRSLLRVIYNPIDTENIINKSIKKTSYSNKDYLFYFGRIEKVKALDNLIILYNKSKLFLLYDLIIMGEGSELNNLKELTRKLKLQKYIVFLRFSMNPYNILLNSKMFILPSKYEGYSNSLIQSIVLKKNILVSRSKGGNKEILENYYSQLSFDFSSTSNPIEFKNKVMSIINNYSSKEKNILLSKIKKKHDHTLQLYLDVIYE